MKRSNFKINGAAITAATATFITAPALGFVTVATGLSAAVGFGRRVNRPLYNRGSRLGLYSGRRPGYHILCGKVRQGGGGQRRNLHKVSSLKLGITPVLLLQRNEGSLKHLVGDSILEGCVQDNRVDQSPCKVV